MEYSNQDFYLREPGILEIFFLDNDIREKLHYGLSIHRKNLNGYSIIMGKNGKTKLEVKDSSVNMDLLNVYLNSDQNRLKCDISFFAHGKKRHYNDIQECRLEITNKRAKLIEIRIQEEFMQDVDDIASCVLVFEMDNFDQVKIEKRHNTTAYKLE